MNATVRNILLGGALVGLAGANGYQYWRAEKMDQEFADWRGSVSSEISELRESSKTGMASSTQRMERLQTDLAEARRQASSAAGRAKADAQKHAEQLAKQIADEQTKQGERLASVGTELTEVKESTTTANTKITEVGQQVTAAKSEIDKTITDLKRMTGDMGVMSGLIATNSTELSALRQLGERNYTEFKILKSDKPQRVGDILVALKKVDAKRNKYTVQIVADDKSVEKKDKNTNEPVQFYVSKARQPYEIVVNEVGKNQIVGYLAAPKVQVARAQ